jgi:hypothetical protein
MTTMKTATYSPIRNEQPPAAYDCWTNETRTGYRDAVDPQTMDEETNALARWESHRNATQRDQIQAFPRIITKADRTTLIHGLRVAAREHLRTALAMDEAEPLRALLIAQHHDATNLANLFEDTEEITVRP